MGMVLQCLLLALDSIRTRPLRSVITSLGIVVSVASVIAVVSIIQGLSYSVIRNFEGLGTNVLTIQSSTPFREQLLGQSNRLQMKDYLLIKAKFGDIGRIVPSFAPFGQFGARISSGAETNQTRMLAATATYKDTIRVFPRIGRFVTDSDNRSARQVCVIGEQVRKNLKLAANPIGQFVEVGGFSLKIVGIMETRGDLLGISQDDYMVVPFAIGQRIMPNESLQDITILIDVTDLSRLGELQRRIEGTLRQAHALSPGEDDDFRVQTAQQLTRSVSSVTDSITYVLGGVVGISLLVGGIGIMNIMLVSVTERTREIGICKALGAPRHVILLQFLLEAVVLSLMGGVIGVFAGWIIGLLGTLFIPGLPPPMIPGWSIGLSLAFSTMVGLLFGVVPAAKASDLDPLAALRYE
jgi:putative ABC transport system permease protein